MSRILIAAAHKSSGKTTITVGVCAALRAQGVSVQPFKKGPDYIDPMWLGMACGRDCYNLDFHTMSLAEIRAVFKQHAENTSISVVEGNKGLYDSVDLEGNCSNAALAKLLNIPVVLVIDTRGMTRGIAPLLLGYQQFDREVNIVGVILNQLGGSRHESKIRSIVEHYTDIPVLGAVHRFSDVEIDERHLGLIPSNESRVAEQKLTAIRDHVQAQVDLLELQSIASHHQASDNTYLFKSNPVPRHRVRLGIAQDAAFGFYYPDDLAALKAAGAELVPINTLQDKQLPDIDGLFIGGGFPETQALALQANHQLRRQIKIAIDHGLPTYAECGGLMYLSRSLTWGDKRYDMVGVIPGDAMMCKRPQGRGYTILQETGAGLWPLQNKMGHLQRFNAHEFHYSRLDNLPKDAKFAYKVLRGKGISGKHDGFIYKNLLANYSHLRHVVNNPWIDRFIAFVASCQYQAHAQSSVNAYCHDRFHSSVVSKK